MPNKRCAILIDVAPLVKKSVSNCSYALCVSKLSVAVSKAILKQFREFGHEDDNYAKREDAQRQNASKPAALQKAR